MLANSLVAFIHFASAFGIVATVFFEWLTFSRQPTVQEARRIALSDRWYGIFATVLLAAGFARAIKFEKGWDYYAANPFFHLKLTLFLVMGLLSIYPTIRFIKWGAELRAGQAPAVSDSQYQAISRCLGAQLLLALGVLLSASLMAKGMGF